MTPTGKWHSIPINTKPAEGFANPVYYVDLTTQLQEVAKGEHGDGLLNVFLPHTTCTLIFNSGVDGTTLQAIRLFGALQVPLDRPFVHPHDGPQDAAPQIRCVFGVQSLQLPIIDGELGIGHSQGVYLLEMDAPRHPPVQFAVQTF